MIRRTGTRADTSCNGVGTELAVWTHTTGPYYGNLIQPNVLSPGTIIPSYLETLPALHVSSCTAHIYIYIAKVIYVEKIKIFILLIWNGI